MPKSSSQTTIADFLDTLPPERRREVERVRKVLRRYMPRGYEEVISKNMLVYQVPFELYSDTYNKQPLWYVALASEKSYLSLHLVPIYGDAAQAKRLKDGFKAAGKKLDMGKGCIHFKSADELELDVIGGIVASTPPDRWVDIVKAAKAARRR